MKLNTDGNTRTMPTAATKNTERISRVWQPCELPKNYILPEGFMAFFQPLCDAFVPRWHELLNMRRQMLDAAHRGVLPDYLPASPHAGEPVRIQLPSWCQDQRNQMTGPASEAALVVKMLNSSSPGVMICLEDVLVNTGEHLIRGIENAVQACYGTLTYHDAKRNEVVGIKPSDTVLWIRPGGLWLHLGGVLPDQYVPEALFIVAMIAYMVDRNRLRHNLSWYLAKSQTWQEGQWWADVLKAVARARGWEPDYMKCMALTETYPLPFQMGEFIAALKDHILGLNFGRWDAMASRGLYNLKRPEWVYPDRDTIPHDVAFNQMVRRNMVKMCHERGILAIGGMSALFPDKFDEGLNEEALQVLIEDKRNEAMLGCDGAWTGHPAQNNAAMKQFPYPNQLSVIPEIEDRPNIDLPPVGIGKRTVQGTRDMVRASISYNYGIFSGKGASLVGRRQKRMEDRATDFLARVGLLQRMEHSGEVSIVDEHGAAVMHTPELLRHLFREETEILVDEAKAGSDSDVSRTLHAAADFTLQVVLSGAFEQEPC